MREKRATQLDLRFSKSVKIATASVRGGFDIYNLLNASPVLAIATRFGPTWLQPSNIMDARLMKVEVQVSF